MRLNHLVLHRRQHNLRYEQPRWPAALADKSPIGSFQISQTCKTHRTIAPNSNPLEQHTSVFEQPGVFECHWD